jgi:hypothetical protein
MRTAALLLSGNGHAPGPQICELICALGYRLDRFSVKIDRLSRIESDSWHG